MEDDILQQPSVRGKRPLRRAGSALQTTPNLDGLLPVPRKRAETADGQTGVPMPGGVAQTIPDLDEDAPSSHRFAETCDGHMPMPCSFDEHVPMPRVRAESDRPLAQDPALLVQLQQAASILMKVQTQLAKHVHDTTATKSDPYEQEGGPGKNAAAAPRSLERLRIVRRTVDDALEVAEALDEDALVQVILKQHDRALRAREQAEAHSKQERRNIEGVKWNVIELERRMLRSQSTHRRLGVDGSAQRLSEFEKQHSNVEEMHSNLTNDLRSISETLSSQLRQNGELGETMRQICQARDVAMVENAKASQLLASGETLEVLRKAKERERLAAEAELAQAQAECQAEFARLNEGWLAAENNSMIQMRELQAEVRSMQRSLDEKSREAEQNLNKQSSEWNQCADDVGKSMTHGMKALEDLRKQKALQLHRERLRSREQERDLAASTQRRLDAQVNEVKAQCTARLKMEEMRIGQEIRAHRHSVETARSDANMWTKRAESMREAYRAHAFKSGAYKLVMDTDAKPPMQPLTPWAV